MTKKVENYTDEEILIMEDDCVREITEMGITHTIFNDEEHGNPLTDDHIIGLLGILYGGMYNIDPVIRNWVTKQIDYFLTLYPELGVDFKIGRA